jgi:hypothetical protein
MALRNHTLRSERLKIRFVEVDESMFYDVERPFQRIVYVLVIQKGNLDEVVEVGE